LYDAIITGPDGTNADAMMIGGSGEDDWHGNFGGKTRIGRNTGGHAATPGENVGDLDMSFFIAYFGDDGDNCFGALADTVYFGQALVKSGKHGQAEGSFWFPAKTKVENDVTVVGYRLTMIGKNEGGNIAFSSDSPPTSSGDWPPSSVTYMNLDTWELTAGNEPGAIRDMSCLDAGDFKTGDGNPDNNVVEIKVTLLNP